jgi:nucleoside-diphosphate-sugar epimerase
MMSENKIHVIFGTGPLGQAVMKALLKRGRQIRMINRSGKRPADVPAAVEILAGDAYQPDFTHQAARDAAVVYQCAQPVYHEWVSKFSALQDSILSGAAGNNAKLIAAENLYMYGEVNGPIHENLPYSATTRKGRVRGEMSNALLEAHRLGKVRVAMARGADFYGPEVLDSSLGDRAILPAVQGKEASLVGSLNQPHSYTYIDDFGEALVLLGEREEALGQAWHVPNPPTLTQGDLMRLFFQEIGLPVKMSGMGRLMMSIGGLFISGARETVEMMYEFEKPFIVDSSHFVSTFGNIATPHARGVQATVAWYHKHLARNPK